MSIVFPYKNIHKETWVSPRRRVTNHKDHIMIAKISMKCSTDVRSLREVACGSNYYLILVKVRQKIPVLKSEANKVEGKSNTQKLKD